MADDVRLIDANALKSKMSVAALGGHMQYWVCGVIDDAPTIDAQPLKPGRWIFADDGYCRCSECKQKAPSIEDEATMTDYCPHCGAKMEVGEDEQAQ